MQKNLSVSVIIPCFNEEKNVSLCASRIPAMGSNVEIIFVNDGSTDKTKEKIEELMRRDRRVKLISYSARRGKGYAVKEGFGQARNDILMILDADMSVMPEELPNFYAALTSTEADFANGTRMFYPVKQSMQALHFIGNKIFGILFSWLLKHKITDTLCGTKALFRKHYRKIKMVSRSDPWGDFDLLLGAAKLGLRIREVPVHYQKRIYGYSKMQPFKHGFILLLRVSRGFREMKLEKWLRRLKRLSRII